MNRSIWAAIAVAVSLASFGGSRPSFAAGDSDKQKAQQHLETGNAALQKGDYSEANSVWTSCLLLMSGDANDKVAVECSSKLETYRNRKTESSPDTDVTATLARLKQVKIAHWLARPYGPYTLITHDGSVYPKSPFILVLSTGTPAEDKELKVSIAKRLKTRGFNKAPIILVDKFFFSVLEKHPEHAQFIDNERTKTLDDFAKLKLRAMVYRLGKNEDETHHWGRALPR